MEISAIVSTVVSALCALIAYIFIEKTTRWQIGHMKEHEKILSMIEDNRKCVESLKREMIRLSSIYEEKCKSSEGWHHRNDKAMEVLVKNIDRLVSRIDGQMNDFDHRLNHLEAQVGLRRKGDDEQISRPR